MVTRKKDLRVNFFLHLGTTNNLGIELKNSEVGLTLNHVNKTIGISN